MTDEILGHSSAKAQRPIRPAGMSVHSPKEYRLVFIRSGAELGIQLVDLGPYQERATGDDQDVSSHCFAGFSCFADKGGQLDDRVNRIAHIRRIKRNAASNRVDMAVDKPRQERLSLQINFLGVPVGRSRDVGRVADGDDLVSANHNGFGVRMFWIAGEDLAVVENALDCFVSARPGDRGKKDRDCQDCRNWISQSHLKSFQPLFTYRNTEAMGLDTT